MSDFSNMRQQIIQRRATLRSELISAGVTDAAVRNRLIEEVLDMDDEYGFETVIVESWPDDGSDFVPEAEVHEMIKHITSN